MTDRDRPEVSIVVNCPVCKRTVWAGTTCCLPRPLPLPLPQEVPAGDVVELLIADVDKR